MNSDISYDPVSVIDEKEAIGETAKIFKDIRETTVSYTHLTLPTT